MAVVMERGVGANLARARRDRVRFVEVPERRFLAVDGCERPGGQTFQNAIMTLYPVAYTLHFLLRKAGVSAPVGTLEGLYWLAPEDVTERPGRPMSWRLMIPIPVEASEQDVEQAIHDAAAKRQLPALGLLRVVTWAEGPSAQILHVGPYAGETPTIGKLMAAIGAAGYQACGPHHEIYMNDPRRVGEAQTKTVLRHAVRPAA
jgi:hypothetical protein